MATLRHRPSRPQTGPHALTGRPAALRAALVLLLLALMPAAGLRALEAKSKLTLEYDLKAAFLFNFAQFVEWPPEAFPRADAPITIGILGEDPFGVSLDEIVASEEIKGHRLAVRRCRDLGEIAGCQILFIAPSHPVDRKLRESIEGKPILTVGETEEFSAGSGIVRFLVVDNKVRLRINLEAARKARLTISSKLLRQAEIVGR